MSIFSIGKSKGRDIYRLGISELIKREHPFISDVEFGTDDITIDVDFYKTLWERGGQEAAIRLDDDIIDSFQELKNVIFRTNHYIADQYITFITKRDHISLPNIIVDKHDGGILHLSFQKDQRFFKVNANNISVDIKGIAPTASLTPSTVEIRIRPKTIINKEGIIYNDPGKIYVHDITYNHGGSIRFINCDYKYDLPEIHIDNIINNSESRFDTCWLEFLNMSDHETTGGKCKAYTSYASIRQKIMMYMKNVHLPDCTHYMHNSEANMKICTLNECGNNDYPYEAEYEIRNI